jgi:ketosteroid isomerase-like protein
MSENLDLVRSTFDAMRRGDYQRAAHGFRADAVWHNTAEFPGPKSCVGPRAIVDFWSTLTEPFDETASSDDIERAVEGNDAVVLGVHTVGRGKASGVPIDVRWSVAFHVQDGKITRADVHGDWAKALDAAGLEE